MLFRSRCVPRGSPAAWYAEGQRCPPHHHDVPQWNLAPELRGALRLVAVALIMAWAAHGQSTTAPKKAPVPTAASKAKSTAAPKKSAPVATSRATAKSTVKGKRPVPARRPQQMQPALERYKEIQQALADKGYFAGPVDGMWGPHPTW